jgi:hypothetical protein
MASDRTIVQEWADYLYMQKYTFYNIKIYIAIFQKAAGITMGNSIYLFTVPSCGS